MRRLPSPPAIVLALVCAAALPGPAAAEGGRPTVVVELFTSQGCSSCPPADRLLTRLGNGEGPDGVHVVPLSFHVDYWNYIGWTDPFSSSAWSDRQRSYAVAFGLDTVYTPQLVIQGAAQVVGSGEAAVRREIERAAEGPRAVELTLAARGAAEDPQRLEVLVTAHVDRELPHRELDVLVALFEEELTTSVESGENARRELRNDFVVRQLRRAFAVRPVAGAAGQGTVTLQIEPGWNRRRLGVAAFAQDPVGRRIFGAVAGAPPYPGP